jgi:hypothetical protein
VLRDFTTGVARKYGLRDAADLLGVKREALRKFNRGGIQHPHDRTRERFGTRYLVYHRAPRSWKVAEGTGSPGRGPALGDLRMIFGGNREEARRNLRDLYHRAGFTDDESTPVWAKALRTWITQSVDDAFAESPGLYEERRRRKPSAPPAGTSEPEAASPPETAEGNGRPGSDAPPPPKKRPRRKRDGGGEPKD